MTQKFSPIISSQDLLKIKSEKEFVLVDARSGSDARARYLTEHLANARFVDLNADLAGATTNPAIGGRHPLPSLEKFATVLNRLGITPHSHVVVYDDKNGSNAASRFWWMLRSAGHSAVQVLDGGYEFALNAGFPVSSGEKLPEVNSNYPISKWQLPLVDIDTVEKVAKNNNYLVIDVRDSSRFNGENEPIDLIAGHIPGAVNIPLTTNLNEDGSFKSPEELKSKYISAIDNRASDHIIVHCGSGITACHTLLAMDYAGLEIPALYVGSWSEWSRTEKPIATKTANN